MTDQPEERCVHRYADGHACDTERESHERLERRSYSHAFVPAEPVKPLTCEVAVHFPDDHTVTGEPCGNPLPCKDHPQKVTCEHCGHAAHDGRECSAEVDSAWTLTNTRPCACGSGKNFIGVLNGEPQFESAAPSGDLVGWGKPLRYRTDDCDVDDSHLSIFMGGNGDWYVAIESERRGYSRAVRITTSGTRVPGLAPAIAEAYRAIARSTKEKRTP